VHCSRNGQYSQSISRLLDKQLLHCRLAGSPTGSQGTASRRQCRLQTFSSHSWPRGYSRGISDRVRQISRWTTPLLLSRWLSGCLLERPSEWFANDPEIPLSIRRRRVDSSFFQGSIQTSAAVPAYPEPPMVVSSRGLSYLSSDLPVPIHNDTARFILQSTIFLPEAPL